MTEWRGETCKLCHREQRLAWSVTNKLWNKVTDESEVTWCLECFLKRAEIKGVVVKKRDFRYFGFIEEKEGVVT